MCANLVILTLLHFVLALVLINNLMLCSSKGMLLYKDAPAGLVTTTKMGSAHLAMLTTQIQQVTGLDFANVFLDILAQRLKLLFIAPFVFNWIQILNLISQLKLVVSARVHMIFMIFNVKVFVSKRCQILILIQQHQIVLVMKAISVLVLRAIKSVESMMQIKHMIR